MRGRLNGGAVAAALGAGGFMACSDSSSGGGPPVTFDGGLFDSPSDSAVSNDSGVDSSADADAAPDGGSGAMVSLANLWDAPIDFCVKAGDGSWIGPIFEAEGGVPVGKVSVRRAVEPVARQIEFVLAGQPCSAEPLFTPGTESFDVAATYPLRAISFVVRKASGDVRKIFYRDPIIAGKENIFYGRYGHDATFVPSGGGAVEVPDDEVTSLDPGLAGKLVFTSAKNTVERPMKTAAGLLTVIGTADGTPILCDEYAPTTDHVMVCGDSVRAP